jgi:hypothetical protein
MSKYHELVGVYHAEGSLFGELRYVVGKWLGHAHCALCDITHGRVRKKHVFVELESRLPLPLRLVHLDEREPAVMELTEGRTPCVVGRGADGWHVLLDAPTLEACEKDVGAFEDALMATL